MSRSKTKAEKLHLSRVAELRCIVCRNEGLGDTPLKSIIAAPVPGCLFVQIIFT
ncbi:hypothetical protein [Citrobacter freundii]|uniref:hypothetical protein n=1 Tax=Citrobacter freundii TaxID=546 RepID=UPI003F7520DB